MGILTLIKDDKKSKSLIDKYPNVRRFSSLNDVRKEDYIRPLFEQLTFLFRIKAKTDYYDIANKEFPEYVDVVIVAPSKVYAFITKTSSESEFKTFSKEIAKFVTSVNPKLLYQLFIRTKADIGKSLELLAYGVTTIQKLNKVMPVDKTIFIKDVILTTLFCKEYQKVKALYKYSKGRYDKEPKYIKEAQDLIFSLGEEYTFNAIKKEARKMYLTKLDSLSQKEIKNKYDEELYRYIRLGDLILLKELFDTRIQYPVLLLLECLYNRTQLKEVI